jgi:hypothetical protein
MEGTGIKNGFVFVQVMPYGLKSSEFGSKCSEIHL